MATFRARKLARKKNGHFQSTAIRSTTEIFLDSRKRKSSDSLVDAIKVSFQSECESETTLLGRCVGFPRSLLTVAIIAEVFYSCQPVGRKLYLDLAAFSILPYGKAFTSKSVRQVTYF